MRSSGDRLEVLKPMVFAIHPHFILITLDPISCGFCSWQNITISWGWSKCSPGGGKLRPLFAQQVTRRCPWFPSSWGVPQWFGMVCNGKSYENPMKSRMIWGYTHDIPHFRTPPNRWGFWLMGFSGFIIWFGNFSRTHLNMIEVSPSFTKKSSFGDWTLKTLNEWTAIWLDAWQKGSIYGGPMKKSMAKSCVDWWAGFICHMSDGIPVEWGRPGMGVEGGLLRVSQRRKARPLGR